MSLLLFSTQSLAEPSYKPKPAKQARNHENTSESLNIGSNLTKFGLGVAGGVGGIIAGGLVSLAISDPMLLSLMATLPTGFVLGAAGGVVGGGAIFDEHGSFGSAALGGLIGLVATIPVLSVVSDSRLLIAAGLTLTPLGAVVGYNLSRPSPEDELLLSVVTVKTQTGAVPAPTFTFRF